MKVVKFAYIQHSQIYVFLAYILDWIISTSKKHKGPKFKCK